MIIRTLHNFKNFINESIGTEAFSTDLFLYSKKTQTFSAEIAELHSGNVNYMPGQKQIKLKNPKTGIEMDFYWYKTDKDGSNEDTYGWRYKNKEGNISVLIIND